MWVADWLRGAGVEPFEVCGAAGLSTLAGVRLVPAPAWMRLVWIGDVSAMTVGDRIFVLPRMLESGPSQVIRLVAHELVHVRQWKLAGTVRFLAVYLSDYLRGRMRGLGHGAAYRSIRYETEADAVARTFCSSPPVP